jgi:hypothetical protein
MTSTVRNEVHEEPNAKPLTLGERTLRKLTEIFEHNERLDEFARNDGSGRALATWNRYSFGAPFGKQPLGPATNDLRPTTKWGITAYREWHIGIQEIEKPTRLARRARVGGEIAVFRPAT